jgi:TolB-like protein
MNEPIMNRFSISMIATVFVVLVSALAFADAPPTTAPAAAVRGVPRVEIFPFTAISAQPSQTAWIGRGVQESLQSEVAHTGATLLIPVHAPGANDDAITAARQNNADLAVIGTYQMVGDDVRVNGHVVNVSSNDTVGSFSATGPEKSLFSIEDALGDQLRRLLPAAPMSQQASAAQPPAAPQPPVIYQETPAQVFAPPAQTVNNFYDTTPDTGYYYPDDVYNGFDYGYGYPFAFYGGLGFYGGGYYGGRSYHGGYSRGGYVGHGGGFVGHAGGFGGHVGGGFAGHVGFGGGHGGGGHR